MATADTTTMNHPSADPAELDKFNRLASRWWDPQGESRPLHELNPARFAYIGSHARCQSGTRVLDVGCGGGILSETLARTGAEVTAIDLAEKALQVARLHAMEQELEIDYRLQGVDELADERPEHFDVVTCMEMLEHVPEPAAIIQACARALKPGGWLFLSTLNRNPASFALGIVAAEYLLGLLPRGTHEYARFIRPSELDRMLRQAGLELVDVSGLHYNPLSRRARVGGPPRINYLAAARKPE